MKTYHALMSAFTLSRAELNERTLRESQTQNGVHKKLANELVTHATGAVLQKYCLFQNAAPDPYETFTVTEDQLHEMVTLLRTAIEQTCDGVQNDTGSNTANKPSEEDSNQPEPKKYSNYKTYWDRRRKTKNISAFDRDEAIMDASGIQYIREHQ